MNDIELLESSPSFVIKFQEYSNKDIIGFEATLTEGDVVLKRKIEESKKLFKSTGITHHQIVVKRVELISKLMNDYIIYKSDNEEI